MQFLRVSGFATLTRLTLSTLPSIIMAAVAASFASNLVKKVIGAIPVAFSRLSLAVLLA